MQYSQAPREASSLVLDDGGLWGLAHDDELLVGHHDDARELREPDTNVDEALQQRVAVGEDIVTSRPGATGPLSQSAHAL